MRALCRWVTFALLLISTAALAELPADLRAKVQAFTYEGEPAAIAVEKDSIVLDYQWSRVSYGAVACGVGPEEVLQV